MIQQRKKDYFQRIIEELFKKLAELLDADKGSEQDKKAVLDDCLAFFRDNFNITPNDSTEQVLTKIQDFELTEQYIRALLSQYKISDKKNRKNLTKALDIINIMQKTDSSYSWTRTILEQEVLKELDGN